MHKKEKFIEELSLNFPEKALQLMGIDFVESVLVDYIIENDITSENFSPENFKYYITTLPFKNQTIFSINTLPPSKTVPSVSIPGDIFFDTLTNKLKIFDGTHWTQLV